MRPDRFFLAAGLLFGTILALVTPPFQSPDEPAHFYRAYAISEGRLVPPRGPAPSTGEVLPASLRAITAPFYPELPFHAERKTTPAAILAALRVPLDAERRELLWFPSALVYTPVPYLPQAAAIALGRACGATPLALLYLARLAGLLAGVLLIHAAIRLLPAYRWLAALVALTPMASFLRSGVTADTLTISSAFLFAAAVARLAWGGEPGRRRDVALMIAASALLALSKALYAPLALAALAIPGRRFPASRRGILLLHAGVTATAFLLALGNARLAPAVLRPDATVSPERQVRSALEEPGRFLRVAVVDYAVHAPRYLTQFIGKLGWLDTSLPAPFLLLYLVVLGALLLLDASPLVRIEPWQRMVFAAATVLTLGLISASLYAAWTPYRADFIHGIQGRYFIPLAPVAAWTFHGNRLADRIRPERLGAALALFGVLSFAISLWAILTRYY